MADQVTVDNATNGDYVVSTDDAGASGQVQRVKLTYSADGDATHIPADVDGLLVNLGTNNDVSVTGTVSVSSLAGTIPVIASDGGGSLTVDGTVAVSSLAGTIPVAGTVSVSSLSGTVPVSQSGSPWGVNGTVAVSSVAGTVAVSGGAAIPVTDNSGSLTIDAPVGTPAFVRLSDGSAAITTLPISISGTVPSHAVTNAGTFAVQESGAALTSLQLIDDTIFTDDAAFTPATSKVSMAGFEADETSTDSVDEGDAGAARMTLDRKQIVVNQPHSAGGCSIFRSLDIDETEEDVKTAAGTVYGWAITNTATSTRFVKFYNATAANVTVGSTTPVITFGIPGNASDDVGANVLGGVGIKFDTAICVAATTGAADNDSGAPGTGDVIINVFYA